MNIGLIGSGGREHALCQKIFESQIFQKNCMFLATLAHLKLQKI